MVRPDVDDPVPQQAGRLQGADIRLAHIRFLSRLHRSVVSLRHAEKQKLTHYTARRTRPRLPRRSGVLQGALYSPESFVEQRSLCVAFLGSRSGQRANALRPSDTHFTTAIDTSLVKVVMTSVYDIILNKCVLEHTLDERHSLTAFRSQQPERLYPLELL